MATDAQARIRVEDRPRLIRDGSFLENDWREIAQRRRAHNRLGFAYQVAFVRVLGRFPQQEPLEIDGEILRFAALQLGADPGRALKTEFLLQYMSEPQLRAKVRRGLLKVEQLHALARAVYYGQRGRISAREVYGQMNACSCLTLILVCIVYWQTREISRIAAAPNFPFNPELIARVSPIEWKNVILYGEIKIDPDKLRIRGR